MGFKVIKQNVLKENDEVAGVIREMLEDKSVFMVDIISSPGSGKTSLLEKVGPRLKDDGINFIVLTGDCYTTMDAERIDAVGVPVVQINTDGACHLDAQFIKKALKGTGLGKLDLVIIENVGNLVCPAAFDLGEDMKIAVIIAPEGHDKPSKYPLLIEESPMAIINKIDLIPYTDFDIKKCEKAIRDINPDIRIMRTSCRTGEGIDGLVDWFKKEITIKKERRK